MVRTHPSVVRSFSAQVTDSQTALRGAMEAMLARLVDAGIPGPIAVRCYGFLITNAIGFVSYQLPRAWGGGDPTTDEELAEARRRWVHVYAGLPGKRDSAQGRARRRTHRSAVVFGWNKARVRVARGSDAEGLAAVDDQFVEVDVAHGG